MDGDRELSRRYLLHDVVESPKGQQEYEQTWEALGQEPPAWTSAERDEALAKLARSSAAPSYGTTGGLRRYSTTKHRSSSNGKRTSNWIIGAITTGWPHMGLNANPKGVSWNIQSLTAAEVVWAGPSNAGLVDRRSARSSH